MIVDVPGIPLRRRSDDVIGYALCDPEDFAHLNQWSWRFTRTSGYVVRGGRDHQTILMHRYVMGLGPRGTAVSYEVDHINGDRLDNRKANLRIVTRAQNAQNVSGRGGTSRFRGVSFDRGAGRWRAEATLFYKKHYIGLFDSEQEAADAAAAFRAEHMPFAEVRA